MGEGEGGREREREGGGERGGERGRERESERARARARARARGTELINGCPTYQPSSRLVFVLLSVCTHSPFPADIVYILKEIAMSTWSTLRFCVTSPRYILELLPRTRSRCHVLSLDRTRLPSDHVTTPQSRDEYEVRRRFGGHVSSALDDPAIAFICFAGP